jgi:hypothetical protein
VTASLTILGENEISVDVTVTHVTDTLLQLACSVPLSLGALARVVQGGTLWLGVVTECSPGSTVVLRIEHRLNDIGELSVLADRFLGRKHQERVKSTKVS